LGHLVHTFFVSSIKSDSFPTFHVDVMFLTVHHTVSWNHHHHLTHKSSVVVRK